MNLLDDYNKIKKMKLQTKVKKIMVNIQECVNLSGPDHPGIFVRGDGARYREWAYIKSFGETDEIWDKLIKLNPKHSFFLTGEFGSSCYSPAIILKGILFVKYGNRIEFGDPSRLKNSSVWQRKDSVCDDHPDLEEILDVIAEDMCSCIDNYILDEVIEEAKEEQ